MVTVVWDFFDSQTHASAQSIRSAVYQLASILSLGFSILRIVSHRFFRTFSEPFFFVIAERGHPLLSPLKSPLAGKRFEEKLHGSTCNLTGKEGEQMH